MNDEQIPGLDDLATDLRKAAALSPEAARSVTVRCAAILAALACVSVASPSDNGDGDRLLTAEEAAKRLGVSEDWLYRRSAKLPFTVRLGRALRFSDRGLERYIQARHRR